jgi:hypothetical protein
MGSKGGGVAGGIIKSVVGDFGAGAAQNAAMQQQGEAGAAYQQYASIVNPATTAGLLQLDKDIASQDRNLVRQEQLISQIDPTLIEASQQALKLLRGEQSSTLAPIERQRQQQRQTLLNTLREQLGPGAETSTAGIQALTKFDSDSNNLLSNQQQQALSGLGGLATQFNSTRPDMLREISGRSALTQAKTGLEFQRAQGLFSARQPLFQTAGANQTANSLFGQTLGGFASAGVSAAVGAAVAKK